jgi:phosphate transport system substrate-binding protein
MKTRKIAWMASMFLGPSIILTLSMKAGQRASKADSAGAVAAGAFNLNVLKPYSPQKQVSGVIRVYGNNYIPSLMQQWETGFRHFQPRIRFETRLPGSEAAMAGLYGGIADLAFIGREGYPSEIHAFEQVMGHPPLGIEISSGSFQTPHKTFALMVFVHKDNPLTKMNMQDLAEIYGCSKEKDAALSEWGQLGLKGEWEHRPIHVYGYSLTTGMANFFQRTVLAGSNRWTDALEDFDNGHPADGQVINAGVYVLSALANDPNGIAYANSLYAGPQVKALALGQSSEALGAEKYWEPTRESAFHRDYPLTRFTTVFLDRKPGHPVDPKLKEFLRYILSRDGMRAVVQDGAYLPLNAIQIERELYKLHYAPGVPMANASLR